MTGDQFRTCVERSDLSIRQLAKYLGVSHAAIIDETKKDEVRELYRGAILWKLHEEGKEIPDFVTSEGA